MADRIFALHDVYDLAYASDGRSRYGAYLAQNTRRFRDWDGTPTSEPTEFAAAAFVVATAPIMSPPYVSTHPRVVLARPRWDEERRCGLVIELATPLTRDLANHLPPHVAGWERDPGGQYYPPERHDTQAAYSRLTVRIPLPIELLPEPAYTDTGTAEVETTKRALRALTTHANSVLTHLILALDDSDGAGDVDGDRDEPDQTADSWRWTPPRPDRSPRTGISSGGPTGNPAGGATAPWGITESG